MGTHAAFIGAAYFAAALVLSILIVWIALDYRALKRKLADYEKRGLTRGSGSS